MGMLIHKIDFNVAQDKKGPRVIFMLMSANRNVFSKKRDLHPKSSIEKEVINMPKVLIFEPSIF